MKDYSNSKPALYAVYYGMLREVAREYGYALTVHGSAQRDFDLVAIPWIEKPRPALELLGAFCDIIGFRYSTGLPYATIEERPHGRVSYTVQAGADAYFDISIINGA